MDTVRELRAAAKMTQQASADYFGIPKRTIEEWESGRRVIRPYVLELMEYKLRHEGRVTYSRRLCNA